MSYKSLLTILTDPATLTRVLDSSVFLAARQDAHLDVLSLGIDRTQIGYSYIGGAAVLAQASMDRAAEDAEKLDAAARTILNRQDVRWAAEAAVAQLGSLGAIVSTKARFADLVLLPHPYGTEGAPEAEAVLEAVLFEGAAPVLLLPDTLLSDTLGKRVVIAWNQGPEAMAAIRCALPLLKQADLVNIAVIDPPGYGPERSDPGGALCQMLVRHGVKAEVSVLARTMPRISDILLRHVRDQNADLLVMGAYGHSRFREALLGGATRDMLEMAQCPVFLAR
ncbi:MAG: universal stress protein [Rhodobacter sp.]|nr:universal stress protein [Rhodobacter sp.]MCA3519418.1 universal stress protein [Rhodobacter sp.]MCA3523678.1 universal stress protein [Rhodobacter sp.]MCA3525271.1 universal stress protein [Rhodobacter sp.]MCA3527683.1 universal stress protein [Rhodobacter sp.]